MASIFKRRSPIDAAANIARYGILTIWAGIVLFPLWIMIVNSFKHRMAIYGDPFGLPKKWVFDGYLAVFSQSSFITYFRNSIVITGLSIVMILLVGSLAGYGLARWKGRFSRFFYSFFLLGMMVPIRLGSVNLLQIVKKLGLMNELVGLLPVYMAMGIPLAVFVLTEFIREVPEELVNAAYIDGASNMRIYSTIILPLTRPALATVALFNLVNLWNDLWFPLIFIRDDSQRTLMLGITRLFGQYQTDWTKILSTLTLSAVPVILLYLLMAKQFIKGLTAGAVKG